MRKCENVNSFGKSGNTEILKNSIKNGENGAK